MKHIIVSVVIGFVSTCIIIFLVLQFTKIKSQKEDYTVVEIDGCQYLRMVTNTNSVLLTHKGNCTNPIHYFKTNNRYKYIIELPENYTLVSTDSTHPDLFLVHASNDTLYFESTNPVFKKTILNQ